MLFTEEMLSEYAKPLSQTEEQRCKNAINMVRDALKSIGYTTDSTSPKTLIEGSYAYIYELKHNEGRKVKLLLQGSYANNTNVRQNSDVDIAVILESTFSAEYRSGLTRREYGHFDSSDNLQKFKDDVEIILSKYFGNCVERKNKSIKINGNNYRVDADTVPCMRYRDYRKDYSNNPNNYIAGIKIIADDGEVIINYPEQHIINGKKKNNNTNMLYKKVVRITKKLRYLMEECGIKEASGVSSFVLESLLWNVPDNWYTEYAKYRKVFIIHSLINYLLDSQAYFDFYFEANGIKKLFPTKEARENMISYLQKLKKFYQYA